MAQELATDHDVKALTDNLQGPVRAQQSRPDISLANSNLEENMAELTLELKREIGQVCCSAHLTPRANLMR